MWLTSGIFDLIKWYRSACDVKVEVAARTPISVYIFIFFAELTFAKLYVCAIFYPIGRENKRMDWVQEMVQPKG